MFFDFLLDSWELETDQEYQCLNNGYVPLIFIFLILWFGSLHVVHCFMNFIVVVCSWSLDFFFLNG